MAITLLHSLAALQGLYAYSDWRTRRAAASDLPANEPPLPPQQRAPRERYAPLRLTDGIDAPTRRRAAVYALSGAVQSASLLAARLVFAATPAPLPLACAVVGCWLVVLLLSKMLVPIVGAEWATPVQGGLASATLQAVAGALPIPSAATGALATPLGCAGACLGASLGLCVLAIGLTYLPDGQIDKGLDLLDCLAVHLGLFAVATALMQGTGVDGLNQSVGLSRVNPAVAVLRIIAEQLAILINVRVPASADVALCPRDEDVVQNCSLTQYLSTYAMLVQSSWQSQLFWAVGLPLTWKHALPYLNRQGE